MQVVPKARGRIERFREVIQDPLNLFIERVPEAGTVDAEGFVTLHNGIRVMQTGYYGAFGEILALNRGVHEPLEEFLFQEVLRRIAVPDLMIELGAYWAHYSMWAKLRHPGMRCIMVEPDAANIEVGRGNFARNAMAGEFVLDGVGPGGFELDPFCAARGIERIAILHADVQGAETHLLGARADCLRRHIADYIFISTHGQKTHDHVLALLRDAGYAVKAAADVLHETTSYDGFVFAVAPHLAPTWPELRVLGRLAICNSSVAELLDYLQRVRASFPPRSA